MRSGNCAQAHFSQFVQIHTTCREVPSPDVDIYNTIKCLIITLNSLKRSAETVATPHRTRTMCFSTQIDANKTKTVQYSSHLWGDPFVVLKTLLGLSRPAHIAQMIIYIHEQGDRSSHRIILHKKANLPAVQVLRALPPAVQVLRAYRYCRRR